MAKDQVRLTTPLGVARYPRLQKADTKYHEQGEYKVDLVVPAEDAKSFAAKVQKLYKEFAGKKKLGSVVARKELDDQENETGNVIIRCKAKNVKLKDGSIWDRKPVIYDKAGNRIMDQIVGGGSKIQVAVDLYFSEKDGKAFCALQPVAVMVKELVEYGGNASAEDFGFEIEETDNATEEVDDVSESEDEDLF